MRLSKILFGSLFLFLFACQSNNNSNTKKELKNHKDANGFEYQSVDGDPMKTRIYTLKNGLTVYLSDNKDQPRIQTFIAVKAGSTYDPAETTGLAHYLEHMMFKGTSKIATINWEEEKKLLQEISDLYEQHRNTDDPAEKKKIYEQIDKKSYEASKYAVPNEYDKMVSSLGAKGTNAYTTYERTVYMNDIPSNELKRWLELEKERFSELVLRLFHTELEAVYEEFNMGQDNDARKLMKKNNELLYPGHPYGTQTTIGEPEHLKNPSMQNIHKYWKTYYVPNNMAICLSGDLNYEQSIQWINQTFGQLKSGEVPEFKSPQIPPITQITEAEVFGPDAEEVTVAYRFNGLNSEDYKYVKLIDYMLDNSTAGLINLNLNQKQKVLEAGAYNNFMKYYGAEMLWGTPREGQTLQEVKDLLVAQIEKIKKGEFDDWLIQAIVNNLKLQEIRNNEGNNRAHLFVYTFANGISWDKQLGLTDEIAKITKEELVKFANKHFKNNYAVVYKRTGKDETVAKVEKPKITPIHLNREVQSEFFKNFMTTKSEKLKPVFVDFQKEIKSEELKKGMEFFYLKNNSNDLFELNYIVDMGKNNDKELALAVDYLPYLGTDKYTAEELQKEFFKLGIEFNVFTGSKRSYISISGLKSSFENAIELLEHVKSNVKTDEKAYKDYIEGILKQRADDKKSKSRIIWGGMMNYGIHGKNSSFTDILNQQELEKINPENLVNKIKNLLSYEHKIFYYGSDNIENVKQTIAKYHKVGEELKKCTPPTEYPYLETKENKVFFVDFDMVQAQMLMIAKDRIFEITDIPFMTFFGEYFGGGLSSIIFQEIRESKALAYSAFAGINKATEKNKPNYIFTFIGTQADKLITATDAMLELMNNMPKAQIQFDASKEAIMRKIETTRIIKSNKFWIYLNNLDKGITYDTRKDIYEKMKTLTIEEFEQFFNERIKDKKYTFLILTNKNNLNKKQLNKIGTVQELSLEEIFNY